MIVASARPYFAPYPGFLEKALRADILVLLDTVQFPLGASWLTRNRLKNDQGVLWVTLPVWRRGLGLQRIDEVRVCCEGRWRRKLLESVRMAYWDAPYLEGHLPPWEDLVHRAPERLLDWNLEMLRTLLQAFGIRVELRLLSEMGLCLREPALSVEIARRLGAGTFLAQAGARKYLDQEAFAREGIRLRFFTPRPIVYPQLWGPFVPHLSSFDMLFTCGPAAGDLLAREVKGSGAFSTHSETHGGNAR